VSYKVKIVEDKTIIDKIIVGVPIASIQESKGDINLLDGVDASQRTHGSVLVYDDDRDVWVAQLLLERQTIDGGYY
jgi:hypothetical protein